MSVICPKVQQKMYLSLQLSRLATSDILTLIANKNFYVGIRYLCPLIGEVGCSFVVFTTAAVYDLFMLIIKPIKNDYYTQLFQHQLLKRTVTPITPIHKSSRWNNFCNSPALNQMLKLSLTFKRHTILRVETELSSQTA